MYYGFDITYIFVIIGMLITLIASWRMKATFAKYERVASQSGLTGREVAERILRANGIYDVSVRPVSGRLTDHYDPRDKTVSLSEVIYGSTSVAAIAVAAHECGHAIQDNVGYVPLNLRSAFVPVANLGSRLSWPLIFVGFLLGYGNISNILIQIGIAMFLLAVIFQIITLPVEFDASRRALIELENNEILLDKEDKSARKVLFAAAMTYVAAAAAGVLQMLRLMLLFSGRSRRRN
ncbi:MAG: zinc metallopeptidase [Lachnoanaerobaculum sp.]|jgi:Predicted Zn-dependent protease|nr:zinc metallopeptidase [Lachnoanaerobaculum sp.]